MTTKKRSERQARMRELVIDRCGEFQRSWVLSAQSVANKEGDAIRINSTAEAKKYLAAKVENKNWSAAIQRHRKKHAPHLLDSSLQTKNKPAHKKRARRRDEFYFTWEWKKARYETLLEFGPVCMCCGSEKHIVVDHIKPRSKFPELELDRDNLQVLCNDCNMGKSNDDYTDFRPYRKSKDRIVELSIVASADKRI